MTDVTAFKTTINQNSHQLDILPAETLIGMWEQTTGKTFAENAVDVTKTLSGYAAPAIDATVAAKLIQELGFTGKVVTKTVKNKTYIIFKGLTRDRSIFTGTRYLASNPQVVDMAIGRAGVLNSVASGARLTIYLVVPLDILKFILDDQQTMFQLIGTLASDLIKVGVGSAIAGVAAAATAAITTLAAGPLIVAIVVGIAVGLTLDALDKKYGVTDKLIEALESGYDNTFGAFGRAMYELERVLKWQALHNVPMGKGIFY